MQALPEAKLPSSLQWQLQNIFAIAHAFCFFEALKDQNQYARWAVWFGGLSVALISFWWTFVAFWLLLGVLPVTLTCSLQGASQAKDNVVTFEVLLPSLGGNALRKVVSFSQTQANSVGWKGTVF